MTIECLQWTIRKQLVRYVTNNTERRRKRSLRIKSSLLLLWVHLINFFQIFFKESSCLLLWVVSSFIKFLFSPVSFTLQYISLLRQYVAEIYFIINNTSSVEKLAYYRHFQYVINKNILTTTYAYYHHHRKEIYSYEIHQWESFLNKMFNMM